jgi:hypothetical protein
LRKAAKAAVQRRRIRKSFDGIRKFGVSPLFSAFVTGRLLAAFGGRDEASSMTIRQIAFSELCPQRFRLFSGNGLRPLLVFGMTPFVVLTRRKDGVHEKKDTAQSRNFSAEVRRNPDDFEPKTRNGRRVRRR